MAPDASAGPPPLGQQSDRETLPAIDPSPAAAARPLVSSRVLITLTVVLTVVLVITVVASLLIWQLPDPSPVDVPFVDRA
jgi:hypothetical protein